MRFARYSLSGVVLSLCASWISTSSSGRICGASAGNILGSASQLAVLDPEMAQFATLMPARKSCGSACAQPRFGPTSQSAAVESLITHSRGVCGNGSIWIPASAGALPVR